MPNPSHFGWGQSSVDYERLALPRPLSQPRVGSSVCLTPGWLASDVPGPLAPGDIGTVLEDNGNADTPYLVQESVSGRLWWYPAAALQPVDGLTNSTAITHPGEGSYLTLVPNYQMFTDAGRGPLSLSTTANAYGVVVMESGQRFRVRSCHSGKDWWYDYGAVRSVNLRYVPEELRARVRPGWGDFVALTHTYTEFGSAADGPLDPGNLGVVVAVHHCPDSQGGLLKPRYTVRACHNGQIYRYQEGAIHLVVQQLLHKPKIPPAKGPARRQKLSCTLAISHPGSLDHLPSGRLLLQGHMQQVQQLMPGNKYWVVARWKCKDDDFMLANLKPSMLDVYAPSGHLGRFAHLQPLSSVQLHPHLHQLGYELLPLSHGAGIAAAGGSHAVVGCILYSCLSDEAVCVFEWDSAETPLVLKPNRVTEVPFVWTVCFEDLPGQYKKRKILYLQSAGATLTAPVPPPAEDQQAVNISSTASSDGQQAAVVFEWLGGGRHPGNAVTRRCRPVRVPNRSANHTQQANGNEASDTGSESSNDNYNESQHSGSSTEEEDSDNEIDNAGSSNRDQPDGSGAPDASGDSSSDAGEGRNSRCQQGQSGGGGAVQSSSNSPQGSQTGPATPSAAVATAATPARPPAVCATSSRVQDSLHGGTAVAAAAVQSVLQGGSWSSNSTSSGSGADLCSHAIVVTPISSPVHPAAASASTLSVAAPPADAAASMVSSAAAAAGGISPSAVCTAASSSGEARGPGTPDLPAASSFPLHGARCEQQHQPISISGSTSRQPSAESLMHAAGSSSSGNTTTGSTSCRASGMSSSAASRAGQASPSTGNSCSIHAHLAGPARIALPPDGDVNIQEIMRQVQRQAESHQPLWQEGTELAAATAAKAVAAAEEWQQHWCSKHERQ